MKMNKEFYSIIEPIIFTASRLEVLSNRYFFGPMNMTIASVKILRLLDKKKRLTSKEILEKVGGTKSNISQRLDLMEKRGYVKKISNNKTDKREVFIELGPKGKKRIIEIYRHLRKLKAELESNFSKNEIENYFLFLDKLNNLIDLKEKDFACCNKSLKSQNL